MRKMLTLSLLAALIAMTAMTVLCAQAPAQLADEAPIRLDRPLRTTLRIEGRNTPMRGEITAWTFGDFWVRRQGGQTPVRIGWDQLQPNKVYETMRRLIDRDDAVGYLRLGIEMLRLDELRLAERAFDWASRQDRRTKGVADMALSLYEGGVDPRSAESLIHDLVEIRNGAKSESKRSESSDALRAPIDDSLAASGIDPWPVLSEEERRASVDRLREFAHEAGSGIGGRRRVHETEHFLLATDLTEREMNKWGGQLEIMYDLLLETMSIPKETDLYAGKCVIFIFAQRDAFIQFESMVMGNPNGRRAAGVCHQRGGDVFIVFYRQPNDADFASVLIHESVHGFMYRYRSPGRLPTWANEGLADYIAGYLSTKSQEPQRHWMRVKNFVQRRQDPMEIMRQSYLDGTWHTADSYPVSHMLVRFLLRYKASEFKLWIDDIKAGADWEEAMEARFGVDAATLARGFADEIASEKKYTRSP